MTGINVTLVRLVAAVVPDAAAVRVVRALGGIDSGEATRLMAAVGAEVLRARRVEADRDMWKRRTGRVEQEWAERLGVLDGVIAERDAWKAGATKARVQLGETLSMFDDERGRVAALQATVALRDAAVAKAQQAEAAAHAGLVDVIRERDEARADAQEWRERTYAVKANVERLERDLDAARSAVLAEAVEARAPADVAPCCYCGRPAPEGYSMVVLNPPQPFAFCARCYHDYAPTWAEIVAKLAADRAKVAP